MSDVELEAIDDKFVSDLEDILDVVTEMLDDNKIDIDAWDITMQFLVDYIFQYESQPRKFRIRVNNTQDNTYHKWLVYENGKVQGAGGLDIRVPVTSVCTEEDGKIYHDLYCEGSILYIDNVATITGI
jgi:hypothetical protein